jgi:hypothetical protein
MPRGPPWYNTLPIGTPTWNPDIEHCITGCTEASEGCRLRTWHQGQSERAIYNRHKKATPNLKKASKAFSCTLILSHFCNECVLLIPMEHLRCIFSNELPNFTVRATGNADGLDTEHSIVDLPSHNFPRHIPECNISSWDFGHLCLDCGMNCRRKLTGYIQFCTKYTFLPCSKF